MDYRPHRPKVLLALVVMIAAVLAGCSGKSTPVTDITSTSATLHSLVHCGNDSDSSDNNCYMHYGYKTHPSGTWQYTAWVNSACWNTTTANTPHGCNVSSPHDKDVPTPITGLTPNTTYDVEVCGLPSRSSPPTAPNDACAGSDGNVINGDITSNYTQFTTAASSRTWPNASTTGANPATATGTQAGCPSDGGFCIIGGSNLTIQNVTCNCAIYYTGTGTLTLRNDILKPDWNKVWVSIDSNSASLVVDHVTLVGQNELQGSNYTKGFVCSGSPTTCDVGFSDISHICQNDVGTGSFNIHDNYIHDMGGNDAACHATPIEDEFGGDEPRTIRHNTLDEKPGSSTGPGGTDGIFLQGYQGTIAPITIDNNAIHLWYTGIDISASGQPVQPQVVTNNCFVMSGGSPAAGTSGPYYSTWSGNTQCSLSYVDSGVTVPQPPG